MDARKMESLTSGTIAGAGSFRCQRCGYVLNLAAADALSDCPSCGSSNFVRASLFSAGHRLEEAPTIPAESQHARTELVARARQQADTGGEHIVYEQDGELVDVALTREWTRIGRSLTADVRFDDPTVSRRHALIVRHPDGVRVLDDRSLNGVFVNGERIEWRVLRDGDEIVVGRYKLHFLHLGAVPAPGARLAAGHHADDNAA
jgi:predicted  nucleic acid-binding Zn-ribbon protein